MKKINDLKSKFENYVRNQPINPGYQKQLISHFNNKSVWHSLRNLDVTEYNKKYRNLTGKGFYTQLKKEGYEILNLDSSNRDAFSNVHKYLKAVIEIYDQIQTIYTEEEKNYLNNSILEEESESFVWTKEPKQKCDLQNTTESLVYKRDIGVAKNALIRAKFLCEYNNKHELFLRKGSQDKFYTEAHHLIPLSKTPEFEFSLDVEENIVSLCSHCHNLLHYGRFEDKKNILEKLFKERKTALAKCNLNISLQDLFTYYK